jgi:hypothetical protein
METKLIALSVIKDEMLMDKNVNASVIIRATKLAENDEYLYDLINDWMTVVDPNIKNMLLDEVVNYTEEIERKNDNF